MTNGDRFRQMTDEELAETILENRGKGFSCEHCSKLNAICYRQKMNCKKHVIEWLKQEVQENVER